MGRHGSSSRSKREAASSKSSHRSRRRQHSSDDAQSESEPTTASASDSSESCDVTPPRRSRSRSHSRSQRRSRDSDDQSSDDDDRKKKNRRRRKITEEDIAEYMAKKAQRKAAKVAKMLKSQDVSGYANDSNPFGDSNLNEKFVWRKKIERDVTQGVPLDAFSLKAEKKRQRERMVTVCTYACLRFVGSSEYQ